MPELLKQSKLPAVNHMVSEQNLCEAFRAFVTNVPMVTDKLRWRSDRAHEMLTRQSDSHKLKTPGLGEALGGSFAQKAVKIWNAMPLEIRKEDNKRKFRIKVKTFCSSLPL